MTLGIAHFDDHMGVLAFRLAGIRTWPEVGAGRSAAGIEVGYSLLYILSADVGLQIPVGGGHAHDTKLTWTVGIGIPFLSTAMWARRR